MDSRPGGSRTYTWIKFIIELVVPMSRGGSRTSNYKEARRPGDCLWCSDSLFAPFRLMGRPGFCLCLSASREAEEWVMELRIPTELLTLDMRHRASLSEFRPPGDDASHDPSMGLSDTLLARLDAQLAFSFYSAGSSRASTYLKSREGKRRSFV